MMDCGDSRFNQVKKEIIMHEELIEPLPNKVDNGAAGRMPLFPW